MTIVLAIASGIVGLLVGSFLNVVIYRVPLGRSVVAPRSACPTCGAHIAAGDNVPIISWLILRGRCRHCSSPISARYPLIEAATGALFAIMAVRFTGGLDDAPAAVIATALVVLVAFLYLGGAGIALAAIDLETHRLPNVIVYPAYAVGALLLLIAAITAQDFEPLARAAAGMAILFAAYLVMALAYPGGMGFGDVKLAGVLGLYLGWLGWGTLVVGAFGAFLLGGVFSIALLLTRKVNRKSGIPFGPWMLAGAFLGILFGEQLWNAYLSAMGLGRTL